MARKENEQIITFRDVGALSARLGRIRTQSNAERAINEAALSLL